MLANSIGRIRLAPPDRNWSHFSAFHQLEARRFHGPSNVFNGVTGRNMGHNATSRQTRKSAAIKGQTAKQPYAIAMKDGSPFGIGGYGRTGMIQPQASGYAPSRSSQRMPTSWSRNSQPHAPDARTPDFTRWLSDEPDPGELMRPFPAEPMRMWPISTRVEKPENDDPSIVEPIAIATSAA
jgi:hypothetical protein